ncbi:hypothetical protein PI23P_09960 [Polaribacter irgensii 23-P]|uniref:Uncharacterized protein n=1 Tax=Polaribacter irgensii 23-P TaxID=313594 RepID=A4C0K1_9FLAO|nr:hypothetical protein PI23P_09960 [Polaribacter irgensii 23-P]
MEDQKNESKVMHAGKKTTDNNLQEQTLILASLQKSYRILLTKFGI